MSMQRGQKRVANLYCMSSATGRSKSEDGRQKSSSPSDRQVCQLQWDSRLVQAPCHCKEHLRQFPCLRETLGLTSDQRMPEHRLFKTHMSTGGRVPRHHHSMGIVDGWSGLAGGLSGAGITQVPALSRPLPPLFQLANLATACDFRRRPWYHSAVLRWGLVRDVEIVRGLTRCCLARESNQPDPSPRYVASSAPGPSFPSFKTMPTTQEDTLWVLKLMFGRLPYSATEQQLSDLFSAGHG